MTEEEFIRLIAQLKPIFKGFKRLNASQVSRLRKLGFSIIRSKKHYILSYTICDKELRIEVNKTPSDRRSGIKTVKDISNILKKSGLIGQEAVGWKN